MWLPKSVSAWPDTYLPTAVSVLLTVTMTMLRECRKRLLGEPGVPGTDKLANGGTYLLRCDAVPAPPYAPYCALKQISRLCMRCRDWPVVSARLWLPATAHACPLSCDCRRAVIRKTCASAMSPQSGDFRSEPSSSALL